MTAPTINEAADDLFDYGSEHWQVTRYGTDMDAERLAEIGVALADVVEQARILIKVLDSPSTTWFGFDGRQNKPSAFDPLEAVELALESAFDGQLSGPAQRVVLAAARERLSTVGAGQ